MAPLKTVIFFLALTLTIVHTGAASRATTGDPFDAFVPPFSCPGPPPCACTCECESAIPEYFWEDRRIGTAGFDISWNSTHVIGSFNFKEGKWLGWFVIPSVLAPAVYWFVLFWMGIKKNFTPVYNFVVWVWGFVKSVCVWFGYGLGEDRQESPLNDQGR